MSSYGKKKKHCGCVKGGVSVMMGLPIHKGGQAMGLLLLLREKAKSNMAQVYLEGCVCNESLRKKDFCSCPWAILQHIKYQSVGQLLVWQVVPRS